MDTKIEIALSKTKIVWLLGGAIVFIILGILFVITPDTFVSPIIRSPEIIRITGIIAVCFFGLCLVFITRELFDSKPGLIIDEYGITDNTNATSVGLIEWSDIAGIERKQVMLNKFLIIHTVNPDKYMQRAKNVITKKAMNMNNKTYSSPITIIPSSLKIDFNDLEELIRSELKKRKV